MHINSKVDRFLAVEQDHEHVLVVDELLIMLGMVWIYAHACADDPTILARWNLR